VFATNKYTVCEFHGDTAMLVISYCEVVLCVHLCRFIYETEQFNGIGELLEILGRSVSSTFICQFVQISLSSFLGRLMSSKAIIR